MNGVADAFVHVMEQYLTYPVNAKVQDGFSESLLRILIDEGRAVLANPTDLTIRKNIMWTATMALNGLIGTGVPQDWTTHMIGHELTSLHGIDHARTLTIVLPAVMRVLADSKRAKLLQYAQNVWQITEGSDEEKIQQAISRTEDFFRELGLPVRLSEVSLDDQFSDSLLRHFLLTFIFVLAAVTDWLDGYFARKLNMTSAFGRFLDQLEMDKLGKAPKSSPIAKGVPRTTAKIMDKGLLYRLYRTRNRVF